MSWFFKPVKPQDFFPVAGRCFVMLLAVITLGIIQSKALFRNNNGAFQDVKKECLCVCSDVCSRSACSGMSAVGFARGELGFKPLLKVS